MPRSFSSATAEQVIDVTCSVAAAVGTAKIPYVAAFCDMTEPAAASALDLAADIGLIVLKGDGYRAIGPLAGLAQHPAPRAKAALLRVALETYEPFVVFRARLTATSDSRQAARQTVAILDLDAERDDVLQTLVDLGTFAHALESEGGGRHAAVSAPIADAVADLAKAAEDKASAEIQVLRRLGNDLAESCSRTDVILPISAALLKAGASDGVGAITLAGNAVESYLTAWGERVGTGMVGAHGVNAKVKRLEDAGQMPKKVGSMGRYLGNLRNAADHGIDPDTGASWEISATTGREYVAVALSFLSASRTAEDGLHHIL